MTHHSATSTWFIVVILCNIIEWESRIPKCESPSNNTETESDWAEWVETPVLLILELYTSRYTVQCTPSIHPDPVFSYNWAGLNLFVKLCGWSHFSVLLYIELLLLLLQIYKLALIIKRVNTVVIYRIVMYYIVNRNKFIVCMYCM